MEDSTTTYQNGENQEQFQENFNFAEDSGFTAEGQTNEGQDGALEASGDAQTGDKINAKDDDERKLFVGGLSWETTQKDLKDYFGTFGEIVDVTIKTDPVTGRSRGFGFVLFTDIAAVDKVMAQQTHTLNSRSIDPKRAKARGGREPIKKIFVGGLDPDFPEADLREYFGKFGKIEDIELPFDKIKNQRRAFCFITFETEDVVDEICKQAKQTIGSKECDVKKATPRTDAKRGGYAAQGYGYTGRGRGRGAYNQNQGWNQSNYNYNQNYGYGQGYGAYSGYGYGPGYDYSSWYDQSGYGSGYGSYGGYGGYGGYDYSNWGYGQDQQGGQQPSNYGKTQKRGGHTINYHPYNRQ